MAKLIEALALAGSRKTDGSPNASGKVWAYVMGTSTAATLYSDRGGDAVIAQPVVLDAAGRATLYVNRAVTLRVETAAGLSLGEIDFQDAAGVVVVENAGFTGTLEDGSQGAGGETDLDAILTSALVSFGGTDFKLRPTGGTTLRNVKDFLSEIWVSVKDYGAFGDATHDDTAAIQAAVNHVIALEGGFVYYPPGDYHISAYIVNSSAVSVSMRGAGGATQITNTATTTGVFRFTGGSGGFEIAQLYIDHTSSSSGVAISIAGTGGYDISIHDIECRHHNVGIDAPNATQKLDLTRVYVDASTNANCRAVRMTGSSILTTMRSCKLYGEIGVELKAGSYNGVQILGNYIDGSTTAILLASVSTGLSPISIIGNTLSSVTKKLTISGTVPWLYEFGNGIDSSSVTAPNNVTLTPDWTDGNVYRVNCTGAGKTIILAPPTPTPVRRGFRMTLRLYNNNAGVTTWDVTGGGYAISTPSTTAGLTNEIVVEYDLDRLLWVAISQLTHA